MKIYLEDGAKMPTKGYPSDAGYDLYSREEEVIYPLRAEFNAGRLDYSLAGGVMFDTGVHMEIPEGYFGKVESRSGLNVKHNVVSCGGVIDSHYRGSIKVKLYNLGTEPYVVEKGSRIAQIVLIPCLNTELETVDDLSETDRGVNGIGSTGY